jgi:hypothetical protein
MNVEALAPARLGYKCIIHTEFVLVALLEGGLFVLDAR